MMESLKIDITERHLEMPRSVSTRCTPYSSRNPFAFPRFPRAYTAEDILLQASVDDTIDTPTTIQRKLCLNATSNIDPRDSDDEDCPLSQQRKFCTTKSTLSQEGATGAHTAQCKRLASTATSFPYHTHSITDDYTISHEILGIGESGKVMACYNKTTDKKHALKVLRDGAKARREVELHYLASSHENILTIDDIYENTFGGVKCLLVVVEFVEGGDLLTRFENAGSQPYSEKMVGQIMYQVGSAVKFLHDMNIAHRDIKLENILCSNNTGDCTYMLADFGFAKRPERNTLMESPCCTPFYAAPEILAREHYDKSCDMWALGVLTYILLCGYPPFYSMKGLPLSPGMKTRIASGCYAFPPAEWDTVSENTKNEIKNLLKTDPASRSTIDDLMLSKLVIGDEGTAAKVDSVAEAMDTSEGGAPMKGIGEVIPRSARFLTDGVKAPRLHSIQEEVSRALDMIRLGNDNCFIKNPRLSCNSLLARRRSLLSTSLVAGVPPPLPSAALKVPA